MATIASLLRDRVTLQVRSVDRIFLAGYVPELQSEGQVVRFLLDRGFPIPSPAALGNISQSYVRAIERFAAKHNVPVVRFKKGESKEQVAGRYMQKAEREGRFGVVMIGVAQERASVWRGYRAGGSDSHPHFSYRRMSVFPNYYYVYVRDPEWGDRRSSRRSRMRRGRYGSISTPTSGPSVRPPSAGSSSKRWITASARSRTRSRWPESAARSASGRSSSSGITGKERVPFFCEAVG